MVTSPTLSRARSFGLEKGGFSGLASRASQLRTHSDGLTTGLAPCPFATDGERPLHLRLSTCTVRVFQRRVKLPRDAYALHDPDRMSLRAPDDREVVPPSVLRHGNTTFAPVPRLRHGCPQVVHSHEDAHERRRALRQLQDDSCGSKSAGPFGLDRDGRHRAPGLAKTPSRTTGRRTRGLWPCRRGDSGRRRRGRA